jgi:hypothetical protein
VSREHFEAALHAHFAAKEAELQRRVDEEGCGAVIGALRPAMEEAIESARRAWREMERIRAATRTTLIDPEDR